MAARASVQARRVGDHILVEVEVGMLACAKVHAVQKAASVPVHEGALGATAGGDQAQIPDSGFPGG